MTDALPLLLPTSAIPQASSSSQWTPKAYLRPPQRPPVDEAKELEMAMVKQAFTFDGRVAKRTRPRRTVDFGAGMGRWVLSRKSRPSPTFQPCIRPAPPFVVDVLPAKAFPDNLTTSLCTRFVHTSTNKVRCPINCIAWTPEARRVLTGATSGEFTLWNGLTFNFETILQAHDSAIRALQFSHSGAYIVSADDSGIIKYFQPNMNNLTAWNGHRESVRDISFSPDDRRFATASDDPTARLRIWDFEQSREERTLSGHMWDVRCVEWHASKGILVSGGKDNVIKFWDPRSGACLSTLHSHKNSIQALAWSPNGDLMASGSRDQTVRMFDIRAMKEFRVLKGHKKEVCSLAFHPVHPILVSGGSEGAILHWDYNAPEQVQGSNTPAGPRATLSEAHDSNVWALAFHPLGHILVSGSNDYTTRFWSRERPGDATSVLVGGGERPPEAQFGVDGGEEDEENVALPGFSYLGQGSSSTNTAIGANLNSLPPGLGYESGSAGGQMPGLGNWAAAKEEEPLPGLGNIGTSSSMGRGAPTGYGGAGSSAMALDDSIPGFTRSAPPPLPPPVDGPSGGYGRGQGGPSSMAQANGYGYGSGSGRGYGGGGGGYDDRDRDRPRERPTGANNTGGGRNYGSRWGPRRGGRY